MIVPYWLDSEEAEEDYKQILADNIEHFHVGHPGRSCLFLDLDNETVAGIVHLNNYQPEYKTGDLTGLFFDKHAFTRPNIIAIYRWLFQDLGLTRVNMVTQEHNLKARKLNEMMGAKLDAVLPMFWGDEPAYVYGLLAPEALKLLRRLENENNLG